MKRTKTLFRVNLRVNASKLKQLERVVEYALKQGMQLDPKECRTWWYMLDRWDNVLSVLEEVEIDVIKKNKMLGKLKN